MLRGLWTRIDHYTSAGAVVVAYISDYISIGARARHHGGVRGQNNFNPGWKYHWLFHSSGPDLAG
jgi:hypothetical protein